MLKMSNGSRLDKLNVWKKGTSIRKDKCRRNGLMLLLVLLLLHLHVSKEESKLYLILYILTFKKKVMIRVLENIAFNTQS